VDLRLHPGINMRGVVIYLALVMLPRLFGSAPLEQYFAMGAKGSVVQPQENLQEEKNPEADHENKKSGKSPSSEKNGVQKKEKAPPEKKPRIKYREEPGCSC
jgi:hypothetical protein